MSTLTTSSSHELTADSDSSSDDVESEAPISQLRHENVTLRESLEKSNQQIKLLGAVLRIVHEDLSLKNEQLEILYSNLRQNPVWKDCMATLNTTESHIDDTFPFTNPPMISNITRQHSINSDTERSIVGVERSMPPATATAVAMNAVFDPSMALSDNLAKLQLNATSPRHRSNQSTNADIELALNSSVIHVSTSDINTVSNEIRSSDLVLSAEILEPINVCTKCYMNELPNELQMLLCYYLTFDELSIFARVSRLWLSVINDDNVWKEAFRNKWKSVDRVMFTKPHRRCSNHNRNAVSKRDKSVSAHIGLLPSPKETRKHKRRHTKGSTQTAKRKTWKQQFYERMYVERCWRQGRATVMSLTGHEGSITALKFDKYRMVTASDDGSLILWQLDDMKKFEKKMSFRKVRKDGYESDSASYTHSNSTHVTEEIFKGNNSDSATSIASVSPKKKHCKKKKFDYRKWSAHRNRNLWHHFTGNHSSSNEGSNILKWNRNTATILGWNTANGREETSISGQKEIIEKHLIQQHHKQSQVNYKRQSFVGHGGPVWCLDFDDELLVSGSYDKCIKLWNIRGGNCISTLRGHNEWVSCIKLCGRQMVSSSWDASIRIWQLNEDRSHGRLVKTLQSHPGNAIYCMQWSPDQQLVASGCRHSAVQIWDLQRGGTMVRTLMGHLKQVYCLQMDYNVIVSGSADRCIKIWDPRSAACIATFEGHSGPVMSLQFDEHKIVSAGYDKQVKIFDIRQRKCLHSLCGHSKVIFALQYDDTKIITGSADKRVCVMNFV